MEVTGRTVPDELTAGPPDAAHRATRPAAVLFLAWRNLTAERRRWLMGTLATGVAVGLMLFTQGIIRWIDQSSAAYASHLGNRLVVLQKGATSLYLAQSLIPGELIARVQALPGVANATPIVTYNAVLAGKKHPLPIQVIGYSDRNAGGPWALASGHYPRAQNEVVIDRGLAYVNSIHVGDSLSVLGQHVRVVGLSEGTNVAGLFLVFTQLQTVEAMLGIPVVSDILIRPTPKFSPSRLATEVARLPGVHLVSEGQLKANDRRMLREGLEQPVEIMVAISLVVGLLLTTMVLHTTTVEHAHDFALLKAIGTRPVVVGSVAAAQAFILATSGFLVGWGFAAALTEAIRLYYPIINSYMGATVLLEVAGLVAVVGVIALLSPLRFLRRVDPQEVFKA